jgi:hypothetical protein
MPIVKHAKWKQLMMNELQFAIIPPVHYPIKQMNDTMNAL